MIERIASRRGAVCGLALDHRDSLRVAARRHGYPEDTASLRALKVELVHGLARLASVVLLDVELGLDAFTELEGTPLVVPLEAQGYESLGAGRITTLLGDVDPARAASLGAVGCKLLLPYRPDLTDTARMQEEMVARVVADCRASDMLSIIEPIVYGEVPELGAAVAETARRLARLRPDVLKLQYPGSARLCEPLTRACGAVPWVLLGGGTDEDSFLTQLRDAMRAGARGYIVGRTAWGAALIEEGDGRRSAIAERAAFLARAVQVAEEG
jgi:tagatose 1,6-diphosphate aldolase/sulfofructosephosphate aldolase